MPYKSRIPTITAAMIPRVDKSLRAGAEVVQSAAQERVPVDSGTLRAAIHVERDEELSWGVVAGDEKVFYGHIVEHGGTRTPAQPFLVPALQERAPEVVAAVRQAIDGIVT